jgi:hypothetical protein
MQEMKIVSSAENCNIDIDVNEICITNVKPLDSVLLKSFFIQCYRLRTHLQRPRHSRTSYQMS